MDGELKLRESLANNILIEFLTKSKIYKGTKLPTTVYVFTGLS